MTTLTRRQRFQFPEMPDWFETIPGKFTMPGIRIEDYMEDDCYVMRAHLRDVLPLEEVIDRFTVLGQTTTSIMQSSPVPGRPLDLS